jgi:hypothetical protein
MQPSPTSQQSRTSQAVEQNTQELQIQGRLGLKQGKRGEEGKNPCAIQFQYNNNKKQTMQINNTATILGL